jgi:predicted dehydrogenase
MSDIQSISRRKFLSDGSKIVVGSSMFLVSNTLLQGRESDSEKIRLALVGTGSRGTSMWGKELVNSYSDYVELAGLCDINAKRLISAKKIIGIDVPTYTASDFDRMIEQAKPDAVIITTPDSFHARYIVRSLQLGCDAISEKPLVTEADQCQQILDTELTSGKNIITTFNVRYMKPAEEIKKIIVSGELGKIISAEFQEYLDVQHGASYFRRWHGKAQFSGSLLVHKASHHFDQMNWTLDAEPTEVHAFGKVAFYGKNNSYRYRNCRGCPFVDKCDFYWDITTNEKMMELYVKNESADGYLRDGCVWDNDIDTYDSMTVEVKYNSGVLLSYSLNAFMPYEGQHIAFNGEKGRLDVRLFYRQPWDVPFEAEFRLTKNFGDTKVWHIERSQGGHGGADERLKDMLFKPDQVDPMNRLAGSRAGVMASLVGIAARRSIESGERIKISDLVEFPRAWKW